MLSANSQVTISLGKVLVYWLNCRSTIFTFSGKFSTEAIQKVTNEWEKQSLAAREIAEEFFDSKKVLKEILEQVT